MPLRIRHRITPRPIPEDLAGAAERYAVMGWAVVPLWPRTKHPRFPGWCDLSLTVGGVRAHWRRWPNDNVGLLLEPSKPRSTR